MIYGANGYTAHLVAAEARRRGRNPVLAGRRAGPIEKLAAELGLPMKVFDLDEAPAAAAAIADMAVVANCAGPRLLTQCIEPLRLPSSHSIRDPKIPPTLPRDGCLPLNRRIDDGHVQIAVEWGGGYGLPLHDASFVNAVEPCGPLGRPERQHGHNKHYKN